MGKSLLLYWRQATRQNAERTSYSELATDKRSRKSGASPFANDCRSFFVIIPYASRKSATRESINRQNVPIHRFAHSCLFFIFDGVLNLPIPARLPLYDLQHLAVKRVPCPIFVVFGLFLGNILAAFFIEFERFLAQFGAFGLAFLQKCLLLIEVHLLHFRRQFLAL